MKWCRASALRRYDIVAGDGFYLNGRSIPVWCDVIRTGGGSVAH